MGTINVQEKEFPDLADEFPIGERFKRPKGSIYPIVSSFNQKKTCIEYVAHAYTKNQTYVLLHSPITGTDNQPSNHPDQQYWNLDGVEKNLGDVAKKVQHIEIDCTLLPCSHQKGSCCLVDVPKKIKKLLQQDVTLVIYSHRQEIADIRGGARFVCNTGDSKEDLNKKLGSSVLKCEAEGFLGVWPGGLPGLSSRSDPQEVSGDGIRIDPLAPTGQTPWPT